MKLAVFASGKGSTFEYVLQSREREFPQHEFCLLVTDRLGCGAVEVAKQHRVKALSFLRDSYLSHVDWEKAILEQLLAERVDAILLLGFLKKIGPSLLDSYRGRIVNSHPSLLPNHGGKGMFGIHIHRAVIADKDRFTGVSIHTVTKKYDEGPLLMQKQIPVLLDDSAETLESRVKKVEKELLVEFLKSWEIP